MSVHFYETDRAVAEYLLFHYGSRDQVLPHASGPADALDFPARCVRECLEPAWLGSASRALDLGCAVGRAAFELARYCVEVVGIDYSHRFVAVARQLQEHGSMELDRVEEGELATRITVSAPPEAERSRVRFEQGDAHDLRADLGSFEVVLLANLIDRLRDPRRCLERLPGLVRAGGQLIITSPYTWLPEYTPRTNWLGGCVRDGKPAGTREALEAMLRPNFHLVRVKDLPFLIREHARKYQWSVAEATVWRRNSPG